MSKRIAALLVTALLIRLAVVAVVQASQLGKDSLGSPLARVAVYEVESSNPLDVPFVHQLYDTEDYWGCYGGEPCASWNCRDGSGQPINPGHCACGPASAVMVLTYHGRISSEQMPAKVVEAYAVICRDYGGPANHIALVDYMESYGLECQQSWGLDFETVVSEIDRGHPIITSTWLTYEQFNTSHIVVIIGYLGDDKVIVNDPYGNKHDLYPNVNGHAVLYDWDELDTSGRAYFTCRCVAEPTVRWHPDGALVKAQNSPTVYLLEDGTKRPFLSETAFNNYVADYGFGALGWHSIITVPQEELDDVNFPTGWSIPSDRVTRLIKKPSGEHAERVYLATEYPSTGFKRRRWIVSATVFLGLGFTWDQVVEVSEEELESYYPGPPITSIYPDGALIKNSETSSVYVMTNGMRRPICCEDVFDDLGYDWNDVIPVAPAEMEDIPDYPEAYRIQRSDIETPGDQMEIAHRVDLAEFGESVLLAGSQETIFYWAYEGTSYVVLYFTADEWNMHQVIYQTPVAGSLLAQNSANGDWSTCDSLAVTLRIGLVLGWTHWLTNIQACRCGAC